MAADEPFAFISYRRNDSSAASRWLASTIRRTFGPQSVFIDTESIRMSEDWAERINQALAAATLLIPVIGPQWLSASDEYRRRRIDNPEDWVFNEIKYALQANVRILPVLLCHTPMPQRPAFPTPIADLARYQGFELRDERWESDLSTMLSQLLDLGFRRTSTEIVRYPTPKVTLRELTDSELRTALRRLPGWASVTSDLPAVQGRQRTEIYKSYEFASFEDAISFMAAAAPKITGLEHHPRWQNIWRTVTVWLSTWDIGHKPSALDLELAEHLESLRGGYAPAIAG